MKDLFNIKWTLKKKWLSQSFAYVLILTIITFWGLTLTFEFCLRQISHKAYNDVFEWFDLLNEYQLSILHIYFIKTYLCRAKLRSPCLKLTDRCKHVHAVVHVDLLDTIKHGTEDTAEQSSISVWRYQWELTLFCSQK